MADSYNGQPTMGESIQPDKGVLEQFGVRFVAPLGGRLNLHWLVERRAERLVLRRWWQPANEVEFEVRLIAAIAALGWPLAPVVDGPIEVNGHTWSLAPFLDGEPRADKNSIKEQQTRGRLLAQFHADLAQLHGFGQRGMWRRCEEILVDEALDRAFAAHEQKQPEYIRLLRWHLERARKRIENLQPWQRSSTLVHGDFTQWNLLFQHGRLSGILDFELAHLDHRIADFALSWRGAYDDVILAYHAVSPLEPEEWELITPMWWAWLLEGAYRDMLADIQDDGWTTKQLLRRSPLMGPDAVPYV